MTELKPCPFCGGLNIRIVTSMTSGYVLCDDCEAKGPIARFGIDDSPVAGWNRRTSEPTHD